MRHHIHRANCIILRRFLVLMLCVCFAGGLAASCAPSAEAPILLFNGTGTSREDVAALEEILQERHLVYSTVNSWQLNMMSEAQLRAHRLMIVPGGNFVRMGNGLSADVMLKVRRAVTEHGLNYLGICAGGFLAGSFPAPYQSFDLTSGVKFGFYLAGTTNKMVVTVTPADGLALDQYWENGPQFSGWGMVVAKYPDGTPAVVENAAGRGWVILTGIHPEAPKQWRSGMTFSTPANLDKDYAAQLIEAALQRKTIAHF